MVLGSIPLDKIQEVTFEDRSTFESRVTAARLFLVGPLAFAWKKKEKMESAYVIINWNDGEYNSKTYFEFSGSNVIGSANTARNKINKAIRDSEISSSKPILPLEDSTD